VDAEYLPTISIYEYYAFREFLPQLPPTYEEFQTQTANMERYLDGNGEDVRYVAVELANFKDWCRVNSGLQNSTGLLQFMRSQLGKPVLT